MATCHTAQSQAVHIESRKGWREFCDSRRLRGSLRPMPSSPGSAACKTEPQEETVAGNSEFPGKWDWESPASGQLWQSKGYQSAQNKGTFSRCHCLPRLSSVYTGTPCPPFKFTSLFVCECVNDLYIPWYVHESLSLTFTELAPFSQ